MKRALLGAAWLLGCASRQPEPVAQMAWRHGDPPPASEAPPVATADASETSDASITAVVTAAPAAPPRAITPAFPTLTLDNLRFRDVADCARGVCPIDGTSPLAPASIAREDGATTLPPATVWVQVIRPGARVTVSRRADTDLLGVVLVGEASLAHPTARPAVVARPWTAFRLAQGGATLRPAGRDPIALLLVTAHGDDAPTTATSTYETRDLTTLDDLAWAHGAMHARIAFGRDGSPRASLGMLFASDDAPVAEHAHDASWEVLSALSASGRLHLPAQTIAGQSLAARDRTVTNGAIAYVPAGVRHAWMPDGTHPLIAVQVYAPAGPEQRFVTLSREAAASTPNDPPAAPVAAPNGASTP